MVVSNSARRCVVAVVSVAVLALAAGADRYHPEVPALRHAGVPNARERDPRYWEQQAERALNARTVQRDPPGPARNVVLFLGDGMSITTLAAARIYNGQRIGASGEETELFFESFPTTGLLKTYCTNSQIGDSACTATSYLCGVKTNMGSIGVTAAVERGDCAAARKASNQVESIADWALADGRDVGVVSSARVTHASPAGLFAKVPERGWENDAAVEAAGYNSTTCPDIAYQLVHMDPGRKIKVILGGGRMNFLPKNSTLSGGKRTDGRNLIIDWEEHKKNMNATYHYIWNRNQLQLINNDLPEYLLGLFADSHMKFNLERDKNTEPSLADLTETAIKMLLRNKRGFFLFVEGGRIDHGHHNNLPWLALDETVQLSEAVRRAAGLLPAADSLLVVTADHSHVMTFNGYSVRGNNILGPSSNTDRMKVPYMTLSYATGPNFHAHSKGKRPNPTKDKNINTVRQRAHVDVPVSSETHSGEDVAVFVRGPRHSLFSGLYEQSQLPRRIAHVACIGPGWHRACASRTGAERSTSTGHALLSSFEPPIIPILIFTFSTVFKQINV